MRQNGIFEEFRNAFSKPNNSHIQLILINVVVFLVFGVLMIFSDLIPSIAPIYNFLSSQFSIPAHITDFATRPWTIITYMFMHGGFMHILFNMLWFYWFGRLIIEYLGTDRLVSIYVLGGLAGGILYLLMYNTIPLYMERPYTEMVGASAAVNAIVVAAATLIPNYTFHLLFFGPVKIKYIAMVSVALSFLGMTGGNAGGNIAHLGGAAIGYLYIKQLNNGTDIGRWIMATLTFFKSFFVHQPKMKVYSNAKSRKTTKKTSSRSSSKTSSKLANVNQDEIDAILDKISQSGYESLTTEEKQKLFNASKK